MNDNDNDAAIGQENTSCHNSIIIVDQNSITARYDVETFTFYHWNGDNDCSVMNNDDVVVVVDEMRMEPQPQPQQLPLGMTPAVTVDMQYATTTQGGNIVSTDHDVTGILIWPATYLLCQFLILEQQQEELQKVEPRDDHHHRTILELGCGCGMVGAVYMKYHLQSQRAQQKVLWVSTDMDETALELCHQNLVRNGILQQVSGCRRNQSQQDGCAIFSNEVMSTAGTCCCVRKLTWGNASDVQQLLHQRQGWDDGSDSDTSSRRRRRRRRRGGEHHTKKFDLIVAADIIYPSTCQGQVLSKLFETLDALLTTAENGTCCYISFCNRDRTYTTIQALLAAASRAGFAISTVPSTHPIYHPALRRKLPPLLDAQILILQRVPPTTTATTINERLGSTNCSIFPGLHDAIQRQQRKQQQREQQLAGAADISEDEWDAPPIDCFL
jgi:hypothetical protein